MKPRIYQHRMQEIERILSSRVYARPGYAHIATGHLRRACRARVNGQSMALLWSTVLSQGQWITPTGGVAR